MKRAIKIIVIALFAGFAALQFIRPDMTNPPVAVELTLEATTEVPENVRRILTRSCADCHSHDTVYPWYTNIQPSGWFQDWHIREGRAELNLSEWAKLEDRRKKRKLEEICEQVETREMPLVSYLWIHRDARMSDEEIRLVCDWTKAEIARLSAADADRE